MDIILWLSIIPICWALIARFVLPQSITWGEAAMNAGVAVLIITAGYAISVHSQTTDTEVLNGMVTSKEKNKVSCSHSYECNCYNTCSTDSKGQESCTRHCSTCYEHPYDIDWDVITTVGDISIDRVDRQGLDEPPRWDAVLIGEPASLPHSYTNYLKAAPNSLFDMKIAKTEAATYAGRIPQYHQVYDYYRFEHALDINSKISNLREWNDALAGVLRDLGPAKQVNINVAFVTGTGRQFKSVLERAWIGGKKNDVTIVVGVTGTHIDWVDSFTFGESSGNARLNVQLRDDLQQVGDTTKVAEAAAVIKTDVGTWFSRREMANYNYLKNEIRPSARGMMWILILQFLALAGFTFAANKYDMFGSDGLYWQKPVSAGSQIKNLIDSFRSKHK